MNKEKYVDSTIARVWIQAKVIIFGDIETIEQGCAFLEKCSRSRVEKCSHSFDISATTTYNFKVLS